MKRKTYLWAWITTTLLWGVGLFSMTISFGTPLGDIASVVALLGIAGALLLLREPNPWKKPKETETTA